MPVVVPHRCSGPDFLDKDVDMPVVVPDRCSGPDVQKQFLDKDVDMPVVVLRQVLVSTCSNCGAAVAVHRPVHGGDRGDSTGAVLGGA